MGSLDQVHANAILDASMDQSGASVRLSTGPMHVRYDTAVGTATAAGTELATSAGYTSGTGAPTLTYAAASAGSKASNSAVTTTNMPAATLTSVEVWDSAGTPLRKWWGLLTSSKTTNPGDTFTIPSGSLTEAFS
jgi:hypothetical protein